MQTRRAGCGICQIAEIQNDFECPSFLCIFLATSGPVRNPEDLEKRSANILASAGSSQLRSDVRDRSPREGGDGKETSNFRTQRVFSMYDQYVCSEM